VPLCLCAYFTEAEAEADADSDTETDTDSDSDTDPEADADTNSEAEGIPHVGVSPALYLCAFVPLYLFYRGRDRARKMGLRRAGMIDISDPRQIMAHG
jgi:hypothetical protein